MLNKIIWFLRAFIYSLFFSRFGLPGYIGKPIFIYGYKRIKVGKRARIFPHIRIEVLPHALLEIEDDVAIAQNVHITCGRRVVIKSGACVAANVCITDTRHNYSDLSCNVLKQIDTYSDTVIGEDCFIGFGSVIDSGTVLGKHCIVAANSNVKGVFPDNCIIAGSPAKVVKKL
ncbi:MAG: acyltransferase [Pseudoalteromonas sp.]|uniref:acyltransferase n=1 Tax=Pseudoalteromonas sp. TaxID=53249 RepID=UPI001D9F0B76|nr:acyltransferase [Pseudoalteromonas sp.]NRA79509.1 acyltransferase [Pseudoalteromonas sp.]